MTQSNPLRHYFRHIKLYVPLPSGTTYYTSDIVEFTDSGEIGIMPMTAKDEVITRNPDALLNGEAITQIITSCVPAVKDPKKLLANDIDTLMIAIRHATYGDDLEVNVACPKCEHANKFAINITQSLATMAKLDPEYAIELPDGIKIFVKPFSYQDTILAMRAQFEQYKIAKNISNDKLSDDDRVRIFSKSFNEISNLSMQLISNCIIKITQEAEDLEVTEKPFILEFIQNIEKHVFGELDALVKEINSIGVNKTFNAKCEKCEHEWEASIDFNPINFFTES